MERQPVRDRPAGQWEQDPVRDRPAGGTAYESPGTTPQPFRATALKLKQFWDSPSTSPPLFQDWLRRFDNQFELKAALCPEPQKLPPVVRCRSLVQHLGAEARHRFLDEFDGHVPAAIDTDYDQLCAVLAAIFAPDAANRYHADDLLTSPQQKTLTNDTSVKSTLSVECSSCIGSERFAESGLHEKYVSSGTQTEYVLSLAMCATQTDNVSNHTTVQTNTTSQTQTVSVLSNQGVQMDETLFSSPACTKCSPQLPLLVSTNSSAVLESRSGTSDRSIQASTFDSQARGNTHTGLNSSSPHAQHGAQQHSGNASCSGQNIAKFSGCAPGSVPMAVCCTSSQRRGEAKGAVKHLVDSPLAESRDILSPTRGSRPADARATSVKPSAPAETKKQDTAETQHLPIAIKMGLFWDNRSASQPTDFNTWLLQFDNWLVLQESL